ncbi:MAG: ABC transporter permease [Gammaproteobacteria bacterium]
MRRLRASLRAAGVALAVGAAGVAWMAAPLAVLAGAGGFFAWLFASRRGRQALAITAMGLATVPQRFGATSVIVVGIAGVVGVLVALLAMAEGFQATLKSAGSEDTAIVLRTGADAELSSGLDRATVTLVTRAPGILRDTRDFPIASAEVVVVANIPKRATGTDANVEVRGVGAQVWALRPAVRIVAGRRFQPGLRELIVGRGALAQFSGLEPGRTISLNNQTWTVVGVFASGDTHESEIWGDAESVAAAYRRAGFQAVQVRLTEPAALARFKAALSADPRLRVAVETTREYYSKQSERLTRTIRVIGVGIAVIMAVGAMFGALNTMYAAVAARAREIATLRALGFAGAPVVIAVMLETMLLALVGGILGAGIAWVVFNGYTVSTLGANFSQVVFQFRVTPALLLNGLQWALAIGFVGGLFPALRAATVPVTAALREL